MTSVTVFDHVLAALIGVVLPVVGVVKRQRSDPQVEVPRLEPWQKIATYWLNGAVLALLACGRSSRGGMRVEYRGISGCRHPSTSVGG